MRILVIPDIHGRSFWRKAVAKYMKTCDKTVFLGDYVDPYPFEKETSYEGAYNNLMDIIDLADNNPDKVVLLLGNHDFYYFTKTEGISRYSFLWRKRYEQLFDKGRKLFRLAYETDTTFFTHAGYMPEWGKFVERRLEGMGESLGFKLEPTAESLNKLLGSDTGTKILSLVPRSRGGISDCGSIIWADVTEHYWDNDYKDKVQIFGHTLQFDYTRYLRTHEKSDLRGGEPVIGDNFAMLDTACAYIYDEEEMTLTMLRKGKKTVLRLKEAEQKESADAQG